MNEPIFIEAKHLGSVLEARLRTLISSPDKRRRAREMKRMLSLLRFLKLDHGEASAKVTGLALGLRSDGELGLWLIYETPTNIEGDIT